MARHIGQGKIVTPYHKAEDKPRQRKKEIKEEREEEKK
jgi:hypothetical protein